MTETRGHFPRRTLLGRALSLLGGLVGVWGASKDRKAVVPPRGESITLDTGIRMDAAGAARFAAEYNAELVRAATERGPLPLLSVDVPYPDDCRGEEMPRFVDWTANLAIFRDGRVGSANDGFGFRYRLYDADAGKLNAEITGHYALWADVDMGVYAYRDKGHGEVGKRVGGALLRTVRLGHGRNLRIVGVGSDGAILKHLSRAELVPVRHAVFRDVHGEPHMGIVLCVDGAPAEVQA